MCLYTTKHVKNVPIKIGKIKTKNFYSIAKKNITCWKTLTKRDGGEYKSLHYEFIYKLNKLYKSKMNVSQVVNLDIKYKKDGYTPNHLMVSVDINVKDARHSFSTIEGARRSAKYEDKCVIVECIIPKGARYYHSLEHEEYASNQIILKRVVKLKRKKVSCFIN